MSIKTRSQLPTSSVAAAYRAKCRKSPDALWYLWLGFGIAAVVILLVALVGTDPSRRSVAVAQSDSSDAIAQKRETDTVQIEALAEPEAPAQTIAPQGVMEIVTTTGEALGSTASGPVAAEASDINPFVDFPEAVDLADPKVEGLAVRDSIQEVVLGKLANDAVYDRFEVEIDDGATSPPGDFRCEQRQPFDGAPNWVIRLDRGEGPASQVAALAIEDGVIKLSAHADAARHLAQLRNCVLHLKSNSHSHTLRLRHVDPAEPFVFNQDEHEFNFPIQTQGLPDVNRLYFRPTELKGFPDDWQVGPSSYLSAVDEPIILKSPASSAAKIEIEMTLREVQGQPALRFRSFYYRGQTRETLSGAKLQERLRNVQRTLESNTRKLTNYRNALPVLERAAARLQRQIASLPRNDRRGPFLQGQLNTAGQRLISTARSITVLERSLPQTKVSLDYLDAVGQLAEQLHQNATVGFDVGIKTRNGGFPLLVAK